MIGIAITVFVVAFASVLMAAVGGYVHDGLRGWRLDNK
jgi:hypothetical protein